MANIIKFEGQYWWGDSKNVTDVLEKELKKIFGHTRINSIVITGTDFNDARERHKIEIKVKDLDNEIIITKDGGV